MRRKLILIYSLLFLNAAPVMAQLQLNNADKPGGLPQQTDFVKLVVTISNAILAIVGVVAMLFLIIGGFQYITSAGNPESVGKAKTTILYAIIGLIVVILSWAIVNFVITNIK